MSLSIWQKNHENNNKSIGAVDLWNWGCPKHFCSFWSKLDLTKGIFMKDNTSKRPHFGPFPSILLLICPLFAPFFSLLGVPWAPPGPFLCCAYEQKRWLVRAFWLLHEFRRAVSMLVPLVAAAKIRPIEF